MRAFTTHKTARLLATTPSHIFVRQTMCGTLPGSVPHSSGSVPHIREACRTLPELCGTLPGSVRVASRKCAGRFPDVCGTLPGSEQVASRKCAAHGLPNKNVGRRRTTCRIPGIVPGAWAVRTTYISPQKDMLFLGPQGGPNIRRFLVNNILFVLLIHYRYPLTDQNPQNLLGPQGAPNGN